MSQHESLQLLSSDNNDKPNYNNCEKRISSEKPNNSIDAFEKANLPSLEKIRQKFLPLNVAEEKLLTHLASSKFDNFNGDKIGIDYSEYCEDTDTSKELNNPFNVYEWGDDCTLRAELIVYICRNLQNQLHHHGLAIKGAKIDGEVNLDFTEVNVPLYFIKCVLTKPLQLEQAKLRKLNLEGSHVASILADQVDIEGNLELNNGFSASGEVSLRGAKIGGTLNCKNGTFSDANGNALIADGINVGGSIFLSSEKNALGKRFSAKGQVRLVGATIGRSLICTDGQFINPKGKTNQQEEANQAGNALIADGINVGGSVFLKNIRAKGKVSLIGANIEEIIDCSLGRFENPEGIALSALRINVKGDVFLRDRFHANGEVNLNRATIEGILDLHESKKINLNLEFTRVQNLKIGAENSWAEQGQLYLNGLAYDSISVATNDSDQQSNYKSDGSKIRSKKVTSLELDWIRKQPHKPFLPQPYEQLARVLKSHGKENEAIQVLIGKEDDRRKYDGLNLRGKLWNWFLGVSIGHGYRPERAVWAALGLWLIGGGIFWYGDSQKLMSPATDSFISKASISEVCQSTSFLQQDKEIDGCPTYPKFNPLLYSLDVLLPVVDLRLESYWLPNANLHDSNQEPVLWFKSGAWLRCYLWVHITLGWVLTSLIIAGFSGLVRSSK